MAVVLNAVWGYIAAMTGPEKGGSSEARRKRLFFRAQRRGFKEVDIIFGTFAARELAGMGEAELDQFEALLEASDQEVYAWLRGEKAAPASHDTSVLVRMKALCARSNPTWTV